MSRESNYKNLFSKIFLVLTLLGLIYVAVALGRQVYRKHKIEKEVSALEGQISYLEEDNLELAKLLDYFQKESFKEKEARAKLNFKKPDEKVIILTPSEEEPTEEGKSQEEKTVSNSQRWWNYFFENKLIN